MHPLDLRKPNLSRLAKFRPLVVSAALYAAIILGTLIAADLVCMVFGFFPPTYNYGDPDVGWAPAHPTGSAYFDRCRDLATGASVSVRRNEAGIRTDLSVAQLQADDVGYKIAVTGDSQTDLCAPNAETHPGILQHELNLQGFKAAVLVYGAGRYSPLQDYLVYKTRLKEYAPAAFVLNLYTGNDFNDMLRVDDRPHFVPDGAGYRIAPPVWYRYDDPHTHRHSRVLWAISQVSRRIGLQNLVQRVLFLRRSAAGQGDGLWAVLTYMNDLRKSIEPSVGYSAAYSAQILNQQLFFHHFPKGRAESLRRMRALMELIRAENPHTLLVMAPLPSYELVSNKSVDSRLLETLRRLPITLESGIEEEQGLYEALRDLCSELDWVFVDNLAPLREYHGPEKLYNDFDYHLTPAGSRIVGTTEAAALLTYLRTQGRPAPSRRPAAARPTRDGG
jgi:hypothetical protein